MSKVVCSNNTPLVSIIIPVYNVKEYLEACIESILGQEYRNLEIILVDDGSTDGSGELCDGFHVRDNRVKVIHKTNGGLSDARNVGIEIATGDYIYFLDSDDLISEKTISTLVNIALETNCDVVIAGMQQFESSICEGLSGANHIETVNNEEALKRMFLHDGIGHEACGKLYKSFLWLDNRFPVGILYEDYASIYKIMAICDTVSITTKKLYYYRIRQGSIMNTAISERELQILEISSQVSSYIRTVVPELIEYAEYLQMVTYLKTLKRILDCGFDKYTKEQKEIINYVSSCKKIIKKDWIKKADKVKFYTLLLNKYIFYWVYSIGEIKNKMLVK